LIAAGHDVGRFDVAVHETFAVKVGEDIQDRLKHCMGFVTGECPAGKNLRKVLLGTLHNDIDK
jgi:hypothetical protein